MLILKILVFFVLVMLWGMLNHLQVKALDGPYSQPGLLLRRLSTARDAFVHQKRLHNNIKGRIERLLINITGGAGWCH